MIKDIILFFSGIYLGMMIAAILSANHDNDDGRGDKK